jgi:dolichyl-phosphate-mannose--protein O-mannosyl transferase
VAGVVRQYFDSKHSTLNPYNRGEGSFVYGTLPMLLAKAVGAPLKLRGYDGAFRVGRALSGVFDLVTVWLVYRITRRFARRRAALFAAGLSAFCALGIQLSHFWSVDTFLTTFSAAALLGAVRIAQDRSGWRGDAATGLAVGLAAACKITALALFLPVGIALLVRALGGRPPEPVRRWVPFRGSSCPASSWSSSRPRRSASSCPTSSSGRARSRSASTRAGSTT